MSTHGKYLREDAPDKAHGEGLTKDKRQGSHAENIPVEKKSRKQGFKNRLRKLFTFRSVRRRTYERTHNTAISDLRDIRLLSCCYREERSRFAVLCTMRGNNVPRSQSRMTARITEAGSSQRRTNRKGPRQTTYRRVKHLVLWLQ